jgi:tRNA A37 threonylcarbamoyladenosine dehydratase
MAAAHDADRRFGGVRRLYGDAACSAFRQAHVGVIGVGGVGSWAAEALARSAIGRVTLFDMDHIVESNVNRQLHALDGAFGKAKVIAMAERLCAINPECGVTAIEDFVTPENLEEMLARDFDWLIDCADNFRVKAAIIAHCKRRSIRIVTVGAAGGLTDPLGVKIADLSRTVQDPLLARTRKQLRARHGFTRNLKRRFDIPCVCSEAQLTYYAADGGVTRKKPARRGVSSSALSCAGGMGSVMTVTATFGLVAVSHVLKRLAASTTKADIRQQEDACV